MSRPVIDLPPNIAVIGVASLAAQMDDLFELYQTPQQGLSATLQAFGREMTDLQLITNPMEGVLDSLNAILPKLAPEAFSSVGSIELSATKSLADALANVIGTNTYAELGTALLSQGTLLDQISKTTTLLTSDAFLGIQESLKLNASFDTGIGNFLRSMTVDSGAELKAILGDSTEVVVTVDVLAGERPEEELPSEIRSKATEVYQYAYDHGVIAAAVVLLILRILGIIENYPKLEASSNLVDAVIILLLALKAMAKDD
jgi:hypothetical protein